MQPSLRWIRVGLVAAGVLLLVSAVSVGQVSKGSISGTVLDPTGAAVAGATVKATNPATNQVVTTTTDDTGLFKVPLLPVGNYKVQVMGTGFKAANIASVDVTAGVDTGLGVLKLEVGSTSQTVEVSAATPLVETTQSQITTTYGGTYLNNLPGIQENEGLDNLALLLPGVGMTRDDSTENSNGVDFSVNGLRGRSNDQEIDGQNNNDNSVTGPSIFVSDSEFVNQYQITTNNFGAEYGRNAGSVVNIQTKSGTNTWHGSIYGTENNSVLTTLTNQQRNTQWGEGLTKPSRFNDEFTGATIGGPWKKNKLFFFGGFSNQIISSKTVDASGSYTPTPLGISQLAACFPGSTSVAALQTYGPYGIGGGNPTPIGTLIDQTSNGCTYQVGGVERTLPDGFHQYNWVSRLDMTGAKDTVYARYIFQKQTSFNVDEGQAAAGYPVNVPSLSQDIGISWTHQISSHMLNEFRASYGRQNTQFGGNSIGNTVPTDAGLLNGLASIRMASPDLGFGPGSAFPEGRIVNNTQFQDNWSYVKGRHQFKAGANITLQKSPNVFLPFANGGYTFLSWGAFGANTPAVTNITVGPTKLDFIEHDSFYYFGDDWKVTNRLTLNLGLTYSYYGQPANLFHQNDERQQNSGNPFWNPSLPTSVTEFPELPAPKNSWGPNVGFAYSLENGGWLFGRDQTVIRGGYRLSYDPPFYNIYVNISSSSPQVLAQTLSSPAQPLPAVPTGPNVRSELAPFLTFGVQDPRNFNQTSEVPNFKPDRVHSWTFGIQREFGSHAAFEARYVGNHAQNLFQSINGNPYVGCGDGTDPVTGACNPNPFTGLEYSPGLADGIAAGVFNENVLPGGVAPCSSANATVANAVGRENCGLGVQRQRTNTAYSDYHALQLEFRTTNLFHQLTMKTNYTWSKATDNVSEIFGSFGGGTTTAFSQDPFNYTTAEHSLSGLDFPHSFTVSFYEAIPVYKNQQGVLGHILGGWSVAGSYIIQSGQTYTPVEFFSAYALSPYDVSDQSFQGGFNSSSDTARPFLSNRSAPATAIGVYAADACGFFANPTVCADSPTALYDYGALNASGGANAVPVSANQEHFILNAFQAQMVNGTPFGNAGRNSLRDFWTNTGNFQLAKNARISERVNVMWHMSMVNVFNHPNYGAISPGIDPFIEDAGLVGLGTGFANPAVQNGGNRDIRFGLKVTF